jgi:hypothetical protein
MGPAPSGDEGVEGRVTIGPMCPVVQQGTECPDAPYTAVLVVEDERGREIARIESGADGSFQIALSPGTYQIVPQPGDSGLPWAQPVPFTVVAGEWALVDIAYDSGIR